MKLSSFSTLVSSMALITDLMIHRWWSDWKEAIRRAVLERRKGWVSIEDRLEVAMRPE